MTENKQPIEFKECPICRLLAAILQDEKLRCSNTVGQLETEEMKEKGQIPKNAFMSLEKVIVPLIQSPLAAVIPVLLCHYDVCAKCGTRYCTRVDKGTGMPGPPPGKQPGFPPGQMP